MLTAPWCWRCLLLHARALSQVVLTSAFMTLLLVLLLVPLATVFQSWLKAPLVDPAAIRQRLDVVDALVADQALREGVRDALRGE